MDQIALLNGIYVPAGKDRFAEHELKIWGLIPLAIKVSAQDTGGALLLFVHEKMGKGGPPRHVHFAQDEWFHVIEGEYAFEIGEEKYRLHPGDSLFAPRQIPHAWANISDKPGTLMTMVSPAGTFEAFILDTTKHAVLPSPEEIAKAFADHEMKVVGPPLAVE